MKKLSSLLLALCALIVSFVCAGIAMAEAPFDFTLGCFYRVG